MSYPAPVPFEGQPIHAYAVRRVTFSNWQCWAAPSAAEAAWQAHRYYWGLLPSDVGNLDGAWQAIDTALERAESAGDRVILLITGHHRAGEPPVQRGRIRAAVHDWLAVSRHAGRIAAVRGALPRHGGGGSLYIVLRRR